MKKTPRQLLAEISRRLEKIDKRLTFFQVCETEKRQDRIRSHRTQIRHFNHD